MTQDLGERFVAMHVGKDCFIMPNAWDAGSAVLLQQAGFDAIGTTSAGIAYSRGLPDSAAALDFETALEATRAIVDAVDVPVSMDSENLYADDAEGVYRNLFRIVETGLAGASIEDYSGDPAQPLYPREQAVERVMAARQALTDAAQPFVLTARSESYLYDHPDPFAESVERINRYREAGADCLYVPGIRDLDTIRRLVSEVDAPVNVVMGLSGAPLTLAQLRAAGVTRISIGGSLARATLGLVRRAAVEMLTHGSFEYAADQIADAELCQLFAEHSGRKSNA